MANSIASASLLVQLLTDLTPDPATGVTGAVHGNVEQRDRFTQGTSSGEVDRPYKRERSALGAGATDSYDLLAAGSLKDLLGQTIDADEIKGIVVLCTDGAIEVTADAANGLECFTAASEGCKLAAGQWWAMGFGAAGLACAANSKFLITETSSGATADYTLGFIVAQ